MVRTLQGKIILFLLLPVFLIIFTGGTVSFFYSRDQMLSRWKESSVLKLEKAARGLETRVLKPLELIETLYKIQPGRVYKKGVIEFIRQMDGVVKADFAPASPGRDTLQKNSGKMKGRFDSSRFRYSRLSTISEPSFDAHAGEKTVKMGLSLLDINKKNIGTIEIVMSFDYLLSGTFGPNRQQIGQVCIVDGAGHFLFRSASATAPHRFLGETGNPLEQSLLKQMAGESFGTAMSSERPPETVAGFYRLNSIPWTIIVFVNGKELLQPIIQYRNMFAAGSAVIICAILLLIKFQVGKIVEKIKILSENAQHVALGKYSDPVQADTTDEIGQLIKNYNAMVHGLKERDTIRNTFGRYVDPNFARALLSGPGAARLGGDRREVSILMSDIRNFTPLSETLDPEDIIHIINRYFSHMIKIIQKHEGIIVDFFGDAILVFFDPLSNPVKDTVLSSIQCAVAMQEAMEAVNQEMKHLQFPELTMGIGINTGMVIVGNIGSEARAKYGIVGSAVNVTSRIQAIADPGQILISKGAWEYAGNHIHSGDPFDRYLKGVEQPVRLYPVDY